MNILVLFSTKLLSVAPQQQRAACERVWMLFGAERRLQTGMQGTNSHKHVPDENTDIATVGTELYFPIQLSLREPSFY